METLGSRVDPGNPAFRANDEAPIDDGESVQAGHLLVTIEATKMEHELLASTAGVVIIGVSPGDLISLDQFVASTSPHKGAAA
jgi:biotin carboxyl carrier protein